MYPPVETPTSPDDHNMVILDGLQKIPTPEQIPKMPRNPLKNPMTTIDNVKDLEWKRTSLKLDGTKPLDDNDFVLRNKRFSLNDRDLIIAMSQRKSTPAGTGGAEVKNAASPEMLDNRSGEVSGEAMAPTSGGGGDRRSTEEKDENENYCDGQEMDNKNGNDRIMDCGQLARVADDNDDNNNADHNATSATEGGALDDHKKNRNSATTTTDENENEDEKESYHRLNTEGEEDEDTDSRASAKGSPSSSCCMSSGKENRNSIASSTDESVELSEKLDDQDELQDEFDEQRELLFGPQRHSRRLLDNNTRQPSSTSGGEEPMVMSPHEGPLARRYAEIAQFNGKW